VAVGGLVGLVPGGAATSTVSVLIQRTVKAIDFTMFPFG